MRSMGVGCVCSSSSCPIILQFLCQSSLASTDAGLGVLHSLLCLRIAVGFVPVAKQLVASNSALRTESFYGFLASGEGFTAKARQFRQLQGCIPKFFCGNRETICESNAGIARHSFIVTPTLFRNKRRKHPLNATGRQETSGGYWCHGMLTLGPPVLVQCY